MTTFATCALGCDFEVECLTDAEKDRIELAHRARHHGGTLPEIKQLATVVERDELLEAARALAATGREFTFDELPDVEHHKTNKGRVAGDVHRLGIAHIVGYRPSRRGTTKRSPAAVWHEDRARCIDPKCGPAREVSA